MKYLVLLFVLFSFPVMADEVQPYMEYKSEIKFADDVHVLNVDHLRFGLQFSKFYAEAGIATSDFGSGLSTEVGYKFKLNSRWMIKGKWEGVNGARVFGHKLETEIRYNF